MYVCMYVCMYVGQGAQAAVHRPLRESSGMPGGTAAQDRGG